MIELQEARKSNLHLWVPGVFHVIMPPVLQRVREALDTGDILFGFHCLYWGASCPKNVVFTSFPEFEQTLAGARPGDFFQPASLRQIAAHGGLLEPTLAAARRYLAAAPRGEAWVLRTGLQPPSVEVILDENADDPSVQSWFSPSDGLYVARLREDLNFDDDYFLEAMKPDPNGSVPLTDAY